jgi:hypothetical protein
MAHFTVRVPQHQARLLTLAVSYHLARPGSEIDRETMAEYPHGLRELLPEIEAQVELPAATINMNALQAVLLSSAVSSVMSELKMYPVFDTMAGDSRRPRSVAPGFDDRLRELFPEVSGDPAYASQLAEDLAMLRRDMPFARAREMLEEQRREGAGAGKRNRKPWQFWRR